MRVPCSVFLSEVFQPASFGGPVHNGTVVDRATTPEGTRMSGPRVLVGPNPHCELCNAPAFRVCNHFIGWAWHNSIYACVLQGVRSVGTNER